MPNRWSHENSLRPARLCTTDGKHALEFVLARIAGPGHGDWITYEIHMIDAVTGDRCSLKSSELYLGRANEPEVPKLCAGLRRVSDHGETYVFEPIDERDFRLEAASSGQRAVVRVQYADAPAPDSWGWPIGVFVEAVELRSFAEQLESNARALEAESA